MVLLVALLIAASPPGKQAAPPPAKASVANGKARPAPARPYCAGSYADDFAALSKEAVDSSNRPENQFAYCVRNTATYECLSYAPDGSVRRTKKTATAHGTAFGYKRQGQETLLLTNYHVAEYTPVTDEEHTVANVPAGCKRVSDQLRIVDNERDSFEGDDIPLNRVVIDPALDAAVVKSKTPLNVMPWKVGRSSALRERNVVEVRGFPLGVFRATVQGRVTTVFDHDDFKDWNHDDFVVDAQLSTGNSGSPVLAVNCQSGEYELVGIFHADYSRGNSLNVVVHIDEVRELMTTLKRTSIVKPGDAPLTAQARRRLMEDAAEAGHLFMAVGSAPVEVRPREDGALLYSLFPRDFPARGWPVLVIEDLDNSVKGGFGQIGRVWFGNARGLKERRLEDLDEQDRLAVERTLDGMRRAALLAGNHRRVSARAFASREAAEDLAQLEKEMKRAANQSRDACQSVLELADKLAPVKDEDAVPAARPFIHAGSESAESTDPAAQPAPAPSAP